MQAGNEMGGGAFCKKTWKMGVFLCEKSGKWGCFVKKWKIRFFCKSGPFFNAGCFMYSIRIFYFTFYLFGGA